MHHLDMELVEKGWLVEDDHPENERFAQFMKKVDGHLLRLVRATSNDLDIDFPFWNRFSAGVSPSNVARELVRYARSM